MKKILNNHGESLIEVLVSLLIVALCILMLQGSIVTAAKINNKTRTNIGPFVVGDSEPVVKQFGFKLTDYYGNTVKDSYGVDISGKIDVNYYETKGGYYYYEKKK